MHKRCKLFPADKVPLRDVGRLVADVMLVLVNCGNKSNGNFWLNLDCKTYSLHSTDEGDRQYEALIEPILISETEKVKSGDVAYNKASGSLMKILQEDENEYQVEFITGGNFSNRIFKNFGIADLKKVLARGINFSTEHLQAIVDGKIKEGPFLIECEPSFSKGDKVTGLIEEYSNEPDAPTEQDLDIGREYTITEVRSSGLLRLDLFTDLVRISHVKPLTNMIKLDQSNQITLIEC